MEFEIYYSFIANFPENEQRILDLVMDNLRYRYKKTRDEFILCGLCVADVEEYFTEYPDATYNADVHSFLAKLANTLDKYKTNLRELDLI